MITIRASIPPIPDGDAAKVDAAFAPGKHKVAHFRWACNKRLRQALVCFADNEADAAHLPALRRAMGDNLGEAFVTPIRPGTVLSGALRSGL